MPNSTYIVRQTLDCRIAELALTTALAGRRGMPLHIGINQIDREPCCFSAVLYKHHFFVLYFAGDKLHMHRFYHFEFKGRILQK